MFKIHKEGKKIVRTLFVFFAFILIVTYYLNGLSVSFYSSLVCSFLVMLFVTRFFRVPRPVSEHNSDMYYAPAYGKVVAIEETTEDEYFKEKRIQLSIFMSVWDVHINWYPVKGLVKYFKYHPGKYLLARHPKSSVLNERTSVVLETDNNQMILIRQIAGAVARRVVCYAREGAKVNAGGEMGFIKFGSRVDIFFPLGTEILVQNGQMVKGNLTPLARLKKN